MPREIELSLNERAFILQALDEGIRLDGRAFDQYRDLDLSFGDDYGVADVRLGKTRVIARISAEVTAPFPDRKFDGIFTIIAELSPLASPAYEVGRPTETETTLSRLLEKALRRSSALDTESLCIVAGSMCFNITATLHVLSSAGNLLDCSCVAVLASLLHFRRPDVSVEGQDVKIWDPREREPVKLQILHHPLCVSFSLFRGGECVLVDAETREEGVREGEIVVSLNAYGEVCQIAKAGGVPVDPLVVMNCLGKALPHVKRMTKYIQGKLEEDERRRDKGGLMAELSAENERGGFDKLGP